MYFQVIPGLNEAKVYCEFVSHQYELYCISCLNVPDIMFLC